MLKHILIVSISVAIAACAITTCPAQVSPNLEQTAVKGVIAELRSIRLEIQLQGIENRRLQSILERSKALETRISSAKKIRLEIELQLKEYRNLREATKTGLAEMEQRRNRENTDEDRVALDTQIAAARSLLRGLDETEQSLQEQQSAIVSQIAADEAKGAEFDRLLDRYIFEMPGTIASRNDN